MAGVRTLEELLKLAPDAYDITVFGAEPHPNYNRILLSPVLSGEQTLDQIMLNDRDWYAANGITLHLGRRSRGSTAREAAGGAPPTALARALRPPAARDRFEPVHPADAGQGPARRDHLPRHRRTPNAMIDARARVPARGRSSAADCSGSKPPTASRLRGMDVTVVHLMPWLMERQLDRTAAKLLQQSLEAQGPRVPARSEDRRR